MKNKLIFFCPSTSKIFLKYLTGRLSKEKNGEIFHPMVKKLYNPGYSLECISEVSHPISGSPNAEIINSSTWTSFFLAVFSPSIDAINVYFLSNSLDITVCADDHHKLCSHLILAIAAPWPFFELAVTYIVFEV